MPISKPAVLTILLTGIGIAQAQDYRSQFRALVNQKDTTGQMLVLKEWESKKPNDAELYVALFNYHFTKSKTEVINLSTAPKSGDNKPVAYLSSQPYYNPVEIDKGIACINKGIAMFPNRLDMRFGKTYVFGILENYDAFTNEIVKVVDYSAINHNQWTWADNKPPAGDPTKLMLGSIQDYFIQLYNVGDSQVEHMKQVARSVLKYYPDNVENLSNLAICHIISKDYDNALTPLLKATNIAPTDYIVLNNIAYCYEQKHDKPNAIKYYEYAFKYGDEQAKKQATEKLQALKKE